MLYQKPVNEITWGDVEEFCAQQIPENVTLDYKRDFSGDLKKLIAAFANTNGGIILIGVAEGENNQPETPISGIDPANGLTERVTNIAISNISPPVIPEVQVCPNEDGSKVVIVVRVHASDMAPHAISNTTRVYVRNNNVTTPVEADLDRVEWLKNQRSESVKFREQLIERAHERYRYYFGRQFRTDLTVGQADGAGIPSFGLFSLSMCPLYPKEMLVTSSELNERLESFRVRDLYQRNFPLPNKGRGRFSQDGVILVQEGDENGYYTDLSGFGLYFFKQVLLSFHGDRQQHGSSCMHASHIIGRVLSFIFSAEKYFSQIGYHGPLEFIANLEVVRDCPLLRLTEPYYPGEELLHSPDANILHKENVPAAANLRENKLEYIVRCIQTLFHAFDFQISQEVIEGKFNQHVEAQGNG